MSKSKTANGDGTLRQRPDGRWEFRTVLGYGLDGKAIRKSFYGLTKTEAKTKYKEYLKNSGKPQIEHVATVGKWAERWLELYVKDKVADGTYINHRSYVRNHIIPAIGHYRFEQIKPAHIEEFFNLRSEMSYSARNHILVALRGIFETAIDNGFAVVNPTAKITLQKKENAEPTVWKPNEIRLLLEHLPLVPYGYVVETALYTGCRRGELVTLQQSDYDRENRTIAIRRSLARNKDGGYSIKTTKSKKERFVGVSDKFSAVLDRIGSNGLYIIPNPRSPMLPLPVNTLENHYRSALRDVNALLAQKSLPPVPELSIHKCRHTFATYLVKGGAALSQVQKLLGHSSVRVTEIYAHVDTDDLVSAVQKLAY